MSEAKFDFSQAELAEIRRCAGRTGECKVMGTYRPGDAFWHYQHGDNPEHCIDLEAAGLAERHANPLRTWLHSVHLYEEGRDDIRCA